MHSDLDRLSSSLSVWHRYDSAIKADLFSTSLATPSGVYLVDPIPLAPAAIQVLLGDGSLAGIVITNGNHARSAGDFAGRLGTSIYAHPGARSDLERDGLTEVVDIHRIAADLTPITIDSAAPGETALHCEGEGGTLIVGDALINMGSLGFTFLPAKYCANPKQMRKSLRKLLDYPFERILFAHGTPIVSQAKPRLAALLAGGQENCP